MHSRSRDAAHALSAEAAEFERDVLKRRAEAEKTAVVSPVLYQDPCLGLSSTVDSTRLVVEVWAIYPAPVLGARVPHLHLLLSIQRAEEARVT
jgi:hypothetical protein